MMINDIGNTFIFNLFCKIFRFVIEIIDDLYGTKTSFELYKWKFYTNQLDSAQVLNQKSQRHFSSNGFHCSQLFL